MRKFLLTISSVLALVAVLAVQRASAMDRISWYFSQNPPSSWTCQEERDTRIGFGQALYDIAGSTGWYNNLTVNPVTGLFVNVGPTTAGTIGALYMYLAEDPAAWCGYPLGQGATALPADLTKVMLQGLQSSGSGSIGPLTGAASGGQSVDWLIEGQPSVTDQNVQPITLVTGQGVVSSANVTRDRADIIGYNAKVGTPATTGTQVCPTVDPGFVAIACVAVPNGTVTITSGMITAKPSGPGGGSSGYVELSPTTQQTGTLSISGAATVGSINTTGIITSTAPNGGYFVDISGTTLDMFQEIANAGNTSYFGIEGAAGGNIFTSTTSYATVLGTVAGYPIQFVTSNFLRAQITAAGNAVFNGNLSSGGQISSTQTSGAVLFDTSGATANLFEEFQNSGNTTLFGTESSAGATIFSGTSAYSTVFGTSSARSVQLVTSNVPALTLNSSGNATFVGTVQAADSVGSTTSYIPPLYSLTGAALGATAHSAFGFCTFTTGATSCTITLSGQSVFTNTETFACAVSFALNSASATGTLTSTGSYNVSGTSVTLSEVGIAVSSGNSVLNAVCTGT